MIQAEPVQRVPKLSEVLFEPSTRRFGTLAALPSNVRAIEAALLFANGLNTFVGLFGPSGWGKTHLLESAAHHIAQEYGPRPPILTADEWIANPNRHDPALPLLLDDVQDTFARARSRNVLRIALERRVRSGRPTLLGFTAAKLTRSTRHFLPFEREWEIAVLDAPAPSERMLVVQQMARCESLQLSTELTKLLAYHLKGNGRTLLGALKRLKLYGPMWQSKRATLRGCGLLDPFLCDNGEWDLKDRIERCVREADPSEWNGTSEDLAIYMMLREASLGEADVARYFGIEPAMAYLLATRFERRFAVCERTRRALERCVERVVDGLPRD